MRGVSDLQTLELLRLIYWFDLYTETVTTAMGVGERPSSQRFKVRDACKYIYIYL